MPLHHRLAITVGVFLLAAVVLADGPSFKSTWKAPEAAGISFGGKKVAALVITSDDNLRVSAEEQLVRELEPRRIQGVATYRMAPKEVLRSVDQARPWFERAGIEGVVALRPVSDNTEKFNSPAVWSTASYSTLWGYYGYSYGVVFSPGSSRTERTLVVETLVYSVPLDKLLWAGVATTDNPKEAPKFLRQLVEAAVKEMKKQRLIS